MLRLASSLLLLGLSIFLWGCPKNCGPEDEPRLNLSIRSKTPVHITNVYGIGALEAAQVEVPSAYTTTAGTYYQFVLPVNQHADQTTYVFVSTTRRDTVTVKYRRQVTYEDTDCGYVINLRAPGGDITDPATYPTIVQTTTGTVESLLFMGTELRRPSLLSGPPTDTFIALFLQWP